MGRGEEEEEEGGGLSHSSFPAIWQQTAPGWKDELVIMEFFGDSEERGAPADSNDVISHCVIVHW